MKGPQGTSDYVAAWFPDRFAEAIYDVVILWAAVHATGGSAGWAGVLAGLSSVPLLGATLVGGAYGDRRGAWLVSRATLLARAAVFAVLLVGLLVHVEVVAIAAVVVAALGGPLVDGFHTPAMSSLSGFLGVVGDEKAQGEIQGALGATNQLARATGSPVAGALLILWAPAAVGIAVLGSIVSWVLFKRLRPHLREQAFAENKSRDDDRSTLGAELRKTVTQLRTAWGRVFAPSRPMKVRLVLLTLSNMVSVGPFLLAIPLKADELGWAWWSYALVVGVFAIGAIAGGWTVNNFRERVGSSSLTLSAVVLLPTGVAMAVVAASPTPWIVGLAMIVAGYCFSISGALLMGDINANVPDEVKGSAWSIVDVAIFALVPAGQIVYGVLVQSTTVRTAGTCFAIASMAVLLIVTGLVLRSQSRSSSSASRSKGSGGNADWSGTEPNQ